MADYSYKTFSERAVNRGFIARYVNDALPEGSYLNLTNLESRQENSLASRLGVKALTTDLTNNVPLGAQVHSLARMKSLGGNTYRYGGAGTTLYRRAGDTPGAYTAINSQMSGARFSVGCYRPDNSSIPYSFFADQSQMLKDNGSTTSVWGPLAPNTLPTISLLGVSAQVFSAAIQTGPNHDTLPTDQTPQTGGQWSFVAGAWRTDAVGPGIDLGYLVADNFNFNIPVDATVVGVVVSAEANAQDNTSLIDNVALFNASVLIGTVKNVTQALNAAIPSPTYQWGVGNTDTWGASLTPGIVNSSNFGFGVQIKTGLTHAFLYKFTVTVFYLPNNSTLFNAAVPIELFDDPSALTLTNIAGDTGTVNTTTLTAVTAPPAGGAPGYASVLLSGVQPVTEGMLLTVDSGGSQETVPVVAVNTLLGNTVVLAIFAQTHASGVTVINNTPTIDRVNTILSAAVSNTGTQTAQVEDLTNIVPGEWLTIDAGNTQEERVLVFSAGGTGFTAQFNQTHNAGGTVTNPAFIGSITGAQTASITRAVSPNLNLLISQLLSLYIEPSSAAAVSSVQILLDVGDGSFTDYYSATFQGPIAGGYLSIPLNQLSAAGAAGTGTKVLSNMGAWRIVMTTSASVVVTLDDLWAGLAAGPSVSNGGIPYDYRETFYDSVTGAESNPSQPLVSSSFLSPINQGMQVQYVLSPDPQIDTVRLYRRGGQLSNGWYRVVELPNFVLTGLVVTATPSALSTLPTGNYIVRLCALAGNRIVATEQLNTPVAITSGVTGINVTAPYPVNPTLITGWRIFFIGPAGMQSIDVPSIGGASVNIIAPGVPATFDGSQIQTYTDLAADIAIANNDLLEIDNDPPVTSTLQTPVSTILGTSVVGGITALVTPQSMTNIFPNQVLDVNPGGQTEETVVVISTTANSFTAFFQNPHSANETITAATRTARPVSLCAVAFERLWLAGDPDNPHILYYSKATRPESFAPQNTLEVGTPKDPIMAVVGFRGLLLVATLSTWYEVLISGGTPIALPTGCKHGLVASFAWAASESEIYYLSYDGVYSFRVGASGYLSEATEWIWTGKNLGPVLAMDTTPAKQSQTVMAYGNHELFVSYIDTNGTRRRAIYHDVYRRWRPDDIPATALIFEEDTSLFVLGEASGMIFIDRQLDYDSGGYSGGAEIQNPIAFTLQTAQKDNGIPKAFKQYNELTLDINTNGQDITAYLLFDGGATQVEIGIVNTAARQQVQLPPINGALGQRSLNVGLLLTGSVTQVVTVYEWHLRAVVEAEFTKGKDSFWLKFGTDEPKFVKQGYFEYTAPDIAGVSYAVYIDGNVTTPAFTFTLPQALVRSARKVRFPAVKAKMWRFVRTSASDFQEYEPDSFVEVKPISSGKGYSQQKLAA